MRHSYLHIEEVDEGESKCKMNIIIIKTIKYQKIIMVCMITYFEWFSIGGHYNEFRNTAIQSFGCFIGT